MLNIVWNHCLDWLPA